jgi:hypothetical protein
LARSSSTWGSRRSWLPAPRSSWARFRAPERAWGARTRKETQGKDAHDEVPGSRGGRRRPGGRAGR